MSEYPIQIEKVQAPPLRDDILSRGRLLDWLAANIHRRVVLITAEAGYGKTTLLADFARHTDLRVLWYRLDRGDRDWVGFLAYLLAAIRVQVPEFGPKTDALLQATGSTAPTLDTVLDTFIRELADLPLDPTILILDDFHDVDEANDVIRIVDGLLARAPRRVTFVIASRMAHHLRVARLRAADEVAEIATSELRFDGSETGEYFVGASWVSRDSTLLGEVARKTAGWPASLQLVRTALGKKDPAGAREFVQSISGARGEIYDYLAEEVVGVLGDDLQDFLMTTSVLEAITPSLASAACELPVESVEDLIEASRRVGLLTDVGQDRTSGVCAHPLVREFLGARLRRTLDPGAIRAIHQRVAESAAPFDWALAATHFIEADQPVRARAVIEDSASRILATGALHIADGLARRSGLADESVLGLVLGSRLAQQRGDANLAMSLAERALGRDATSAATITTAMVARIFAGDVAGGAAAAELLVQGRDPQGHKLANAYRHMIETSDAGDIRVALEEVRVVARDVAASGGDRYIGVAKIDEAYLLNALARSDEAVQAADEAIRRLPTESVAVEQVSARLAKAWALAYLGDLEGARYETDWAKRLAPGDQTTEVAGECAEIEFYFGDPDRARTALKSIRGFRGDGADQALLTSCLIEGASGHVETAAARLAILEPGALRTTVAFEARRLCTQGLLGFLMGDKSAARVAESAAQLAHQQGAVVWERYAALLHASCLGSDDVSSLVEVVADSGAASLSMAAEAIAVVLPGLSDQAVAALSLEVLRRPERWRPLLRASVDTEGQQVSAGHLLELIGEAQDIERLNKAGRRTRRTELLASARSLAKRIAPPIHVSDLGRVQVHVGDRAVTGSEIRRKVLALLCLLVTRPGFSASREDVIENLWPDQDPDDGLNSLNQTVYFLRRVFEPRFREELSPGYIRQDGETIWLDQSLVTTSSGICRALVDRLAHGPNPSTVVELLNYYRAPFALDFAYEEWATRYREPLHAAVLRVAEGAVHDAETAGQLRVAVGIAEKALMLEPDSEEIQLALIGLYRRTGAHAAAAEQYAHYAATMKALGVEPAPASELGLAVLSR